MSDDFQGPLGDPYDQPDGLFGALLDDAADVAEGIGNVVEDLVDVARNLISDSPTTGHVTDPGAVAGGEPAIASGIDGDPAAAGEVDAPPEAQFVDGDAAYGVGSEPANNPNESKQIYNQLMDIGADKDQIFGDVMKMQDLKHNTAMDMIDNMTY